MKTFTINIGKIQERIIELMKATQDVDMLSGFQKFLMLDEDGELYITDWLSNNTTIENEHILYQMSAWSTEEALLSNTGSGYEQYYDDYDTEEEAIEAAGNEYYEWEDFSKEIFQDVKCRLEQLEITRRTIIKLS